MGTQALLTLQLFTFVSDFTRFLFCFKYIEGEAILLRLYHTAKICASSGSACTSGSLDPSHVLRALGLEYQALHGSVRFSLSRYNTMAEVDKVLEVMPGIIKDLRRLSPFGK